MAFYDNLCFRMFFLEMSKKNTMFSAVIFIFTIFAHPTIGGPPPPAREGGRHAALFCDPAKIVAQEAESISNGCAGIFP